MPDYGYHHRRLRKQYAYAVEAGRASCWRCGEPIKPGAKWHLGHDDAGERVMGPEHAKCNVGAMSRLRAADARAYRGGPVQQDVVPSGTRYSRHWGGSDTFEQWCSECRRLGAACGKTYRGAA